VDAPRTPQPNGATIYLACPERARPAIRRARGRRSCAPAAHRCSHAGETSAGNLADRRPPIQTWPGIWSSKWDAQARNRKDSFMSTFLWIVLGALYLAAVITLGVATLRKGHYMLFVFGIVFPLLWIVGALMAPTPRAAAA